MTSLIDNIVYLYENKSRISLEIYNKSRSHGRDVLQKLIGYVFLTIKEYLLPLIDVIKTLRYPKLRRNPDYRSCEEECCDFEIDLIQESLVQVQKLLSTSKTFAKCYLKPGLRGVLNVITCLMIKGNLSPFIYFVEILIDRNAVNRKQTYREIQKKLKCLK